MIELLPPEHEVDNKYGFLFIVLFFIAMPPLKFDRGTAIHNNGQLSQ